MRHAGRLHGGVMMDAAGFMPNEAVLSGIRKDIEAYEARRASALRQVGWRVPLFIGLVLAVVYLVALLFNRFADPYEQWLSTPHVFLYFFGFCALFAAYFIGMRPADNAKQSFRDRLLPIIFGFIEDVRYRHGWVPDSFERLPGQTIGSFNRRQFDDFVSGRYDGFPFELYEAKLASKSGKRETTVFRGLIVSFVLAEPFPGTLVATRKAGTVTSFFRGIFGGGLEEIPGGTGKIDEAYEFRTDNAEAARPLVAGRLAKALEWLNESWPAGPARIALTGSDGFLLLPDARNFFELPPISTPLDYRAHVEPMIADMASVLATAALVRKVVEKEPG
jgi:hypothetical protein